MRNSDLCRLAFIMFAILGLLAWMSTDSSAAVTGKIAGTVVDSETGEPLPGVNVILEGTTLGAATAGDGTYFVIGIPPGVYEISASIIGYQKTTVGDARVMSGRTTTLDYTMKSTALEADEAVTVTAERPTIIRDLTATATHVDAQVFESAPVQDTRDLINLNPGILRDTDGNIIIRGGEYNQLKFYVDGVSMEQLDTKEFGFRNNQRFQTTKFQFNVLGVQEMEVITGGFNAEYGDAQSGIVNIVTKEGGGSFHGEFRVEYGLPGQYHHGPYVYDNSKQSDGTYLHEAYEWEDFSKWTDWNNTLADPSNWADSLAGWYQKWKKNFVPSDGHRGGVYDYRDQAYKRALWGVGGPIVGNKVTFFFSGELRRKPALLNTAFKYFDYGNLDFSLTYRITPKMKLKMKAFYMQTQDNIWANEYNIQDNNNRFWIGVWPRFFAYHERYNTGQSVQFTHTLSPTTFYEVLISHIRDGKKATDMDQGFPDSRDWWVPNGPYASGVIYPWGSNYSENGADGIQHNYRYRVDFTSQLDSHNQLRVGSEGRIYNGYVFTSHRGVNFSNAGWNASAYHLTPRYYSGYVQDKMEYGGMIANLGIRADYYNSNKPAPVDKYDPGYVIGGNIRGNTATEPNETHVKISPRLGFSHPVSEFTAFHFQYGHFYQIPEVAMLNNYGTYGGGYQYYPNPNLMPGKTVQYEFGLQHNLRGTHRLNLVVYFNDMTDQPQWKQIYMANVGNANDRFFTRWYDNIGYGTSKGMELTLDRTAIGKWYYRLSYTLSRVFTGQEGSQEQWSDDPTDARNWNRRKDAKTSLRGTDRTHRITAIVSFRSPQDWGKIIGDWDISMNVMLQSGRPFTYATSFEEDLTLVNNKRFPMDNQTDLTIKKWIPMGRIRPQVFLRVTNLLNSQWFFVRGGSSTEDWIQRNVIYTDRNSSRYKNENFRFYYNESRRAYLGVGFDF